MKVSRKQRMVAGGAAVILIALGLIRWATPSSVRAPDPKTVTPKAMAEYLASDAFGKLPQDRKAAFLEKARQENRFPPGPPQGLTDQQQAKLRENIGSVMRPMMDRQMADYFKLSAQERDKYLDQMIDRMEAMRKAGGGPPGGMAGGGPPGPPPGGGPPGLGPPPGGPGGRPGPPRPEMMRRMLGTTDPKQRAQMAQFMDAMRRRMEARGMKPPRPPQ